MREAEAEPDFIVRGVKVGGGGSRMKVLAEIMDAHRRDDLLADVRRFFADGGADIVDLGGFGFDATPPDDVARCFSSLAGGRGAACRRYTGPPDLIAAALFRATGALPCTRGISPPPSGGRSRMPGAAAVVVPRERTLEENLAAAEEAGIRCLIADPPLLQPVGSGSRNRSPGLPMLAVRSSSGRATLWNCSTPTLRGANALLAGMAHEVGAAVVFTSEHSDKTVGSIAEMRRATEMMALATDRPYPPKDLGGLDLLILKEKRRRREPPLEYGNIEDALPPMPGEIVYDPLGCIRIGIEGGDSIVAVHRGRAVRGERWEDVFYTLLSNGSLSRLDHAAYLGKELFKAELAIRMSRSFEQDGPF
ncbi:dihydropteroate synthase [Methanoculleus chikugoensis]|uniref:DUF4346 domain-containing protein n=1 Tax=Methanoculleus chikugoensis TaxID=118126 RepID=UPI001FB244E1|nr:dihydropteroate synthase [Methanoculleus chikugoensis]